MVLIYILFKLSLLILLKALVLLLLEEKTEQLEIVMLLLDIILFTRKLLSTHTIIAIS